MGCGRGLQHLCRGRAPPASICHGRASRERGLRTLHFGWCARRSVARLRPCHWQRAPQDRVRCLGEHRCSVVSTRHMCQTYILATVRPAQITAVWSSTPAPCCAPQGRGSGESWARGGRCARASPPTACALAPRDSRGGLCARASACLQRAGHPSRHCHGALPRGWGQRGTGFCDNNTSTCQLQFMQVLGQVLPTFGLNLCELSAYWDSHNSLKITLCTGCRCRTHAAAAACFFSFEARQSVRICAGTSQNFFVFL